MDQTKPFSIGHSGRYAFAAIVLSNLLLAFGPWMVRLADVGPVASGFWRLTLAAPFLLLLGLREGQGRLASSAALAGIVAVGGLFFAADLGVWHASIELTKLTNATLFGNCSTLLFPIYGFVITRQLPLPLQAIALGLAALGALLLLGSSYELSSDYLLGDLLALLGGIFYFFYLIAIDRARQAMAPMQVLAIATAVATLPLLLTALMLGEQVVPGNWTPLVLLALGSQLLGQGLLVFAIGHLRPIVVGLALLIQPVANAIIGWVGYGESLGMIDIAGAIMICAALVLIRLPESKQA